MSASLRLLLVNDFIPGNSGISFALGLLPQSHHTPLWIREKPERAGYFLLLDVDLAARLKNALAVASEIIDAIYKVI
jgi:hypothetical protein